MTGGLLSTGDLGFEAFGTACGLAIVSGALSVVAPTFDALTATLVALALAGWASRHRQERAPPARSVRAGARFAIPFVLLAAAVAVFLDPPGPVGPWRALLLGLALVPLWTVEQRRPTLRTPPGGAT